MCGLRGTRINLDPFEALAETSCFAVNFDGGSEQVLNLNVGLANGSSPRANGSLDAAFNASGSAAPVASGPSVKPKDKPNSARQDYSKVAFDYSSLDTVGSSRKFPGMRTLILKRALAKKATHEVRFHKTVPSNPPNLASADAIKFAEIGGMACTKFTPPAIESPAPKLPIYIDAFTQTDISYRLPPEKSEEARGPESNQPPVELFEEEVNTVSPRNGIQIDLEPIKASTKTPRKGASKKNRAQIQKGLSDGSLFKGELRVNARYPSQAYVTVAGLEKDVFIGSRQLRNRSLNGEVVAIALLSETEVNNVKDNFPNNVVENGNPFGKVVGILSRSSEYLYVGVFVPKEKAKSFALFRPADRRIPFIAVPCPQVPKPILESPEAGATTLFLVHIEDWGPNNPFPSGRLVRELGPVEELAVGNDAVLADYPLAGREFSESALAELPQLPFASDEVDMSNRRDLRSLPCLTIDPPTAWDLDDALSIRKLPDGNYKVWVHIADVSYFVRAGGALDAEAYLRATAIHLVNKSFPMLPTRLTKDFCSLNPHVDRLALSFAWTLDRDANVLASSYCRSLIHSRIRLSYSDAQRVIDSDPSEGLDLADYPIEDLRADLRELFRLSELLRRRRYELGAVTLGSRQLQFRLEDAKPIQLLSDVSQGSKQLVEEFMLLGNRSAAERLLSAFPNQAMLRCHPQPKGGLLPDLLDLARRLNLPLEPVPTSVQSLLLSLGNPEVEELMRFHAVRSMQRASYVCAGVDDHSHFALGMMSYTHFTSPIRRYSDIVVHRQLLAAFDGSAIPDTRETLSGVAAHCSERKDHARLAQDSSCHLYLAHYLHAALSVTPNRRLPAEATVVGLTDRWMDLAVFKYRIDRRVYFKDMPLSKVQAAAKKVTLFWLDVPDSPSFEDALGCEPLQVPLDDVPSILPVAEGPPQELELLSKVPVNISVDLKVYPAAITFSVVNPNAFER
ncbi:hypothetical protein L0F63_006677 [Massospora cicadina]|nr:hypothetical protein L0F63_006677 [Massospora cicadina]